MNLLTVIDELNYNGPAVDDNTTILVSRHVTYPLSAYDNGPWLIYLPDNIYITEFTSTICILIGAVRGRMKVLINIVCLWMLIV